VVTLYRVKEKDPVTNKQVDAAVIQDQDSAYRPHPYQEVLIQNAVDALGVDVALTKAIVGIGAATGGGKTFMGLMSASRLARASGRPFRVAWVAHGLRKLRTQAFEEAVRFLTREWTVNMFDPEGNESRPGTGPLFVIDIFLPQHFNSRDVPKYDLFIVDEAHERYLAKANADENDLGEDGSGRKRDAMLVQRLIKRAGNPKQLLLTATPFKFTKRGGFKFFNLTLGELYEHGRASPLNIEVAHTRLNKRIEKYLNDEGVLREDVELPAQFQEDMLQEVLKKLIDRFRRDLAETGEYVDPNLLDVSIQALANLRARFADRHLPKTMFIAHSIKSAKFLLNKLSKALEINAVLSDSETDQNSENIDKFENDEAVEVLVVVDRCVLGWNYPRLKYVVDFSFRRSISRIIQTIGRLTRPYQDKDGNEHPEVKKLYIKACALESAEIDRIIVNYMVNVVMDRDVFDSFTGELGVDTEVMEPKGASSGKPRVCVKCGIRRAECDCPKKQRGQGSERDPENTVSIWDLDANTRQLMKAYRHKTDDVVGVVATTTLRKGMIEAGLGDHLRNPVEDDAAVVETFYRGRGRGPKASVRTEVGVAKCEERLAKHAPERLQVLRQQYRVDRARRVL
jgi:superfamily II DNA or RNA helicase